MEVININMYQYKEKKTHSHIVVYFSYTVCGVFLNIVYILYIWQPKRSDQPNLCTILIGK